MNQVNFHVMRSQQVARLSFATGHGFALALIVMLGAVSYGESASVPLPPLPQPIQVVAAQTPTQPEIHPTRKISHTTRRLRHTPRMLSQSVPVQTVAPVSTAPETESVAANPPLPQLPAAEKATTQPEGFNQMALEDTSVEDSKVTPAATDETPLEDLYRQREERYGEYTSTGYLFKVFGLLAALLGGFYLLARYVFPKWLASKKSEPLIPFASAPQQDADPVKKPLMQTLLPNLQVSPEAAALQPQVLSRTRLSPTKEIHVVQVGDRRLVVGSTAQHMTLLAELPVEKAVSPSKKEAQSARNVLNDDDMQQIYRKYLKPGATPPQTPQNIDIPEDEEVVLLDDYEDNFERLS